MMAVLTLGYFAKVLGQTWVGKNLALEHPVKQIVTDSRRVLPGDLFIAIPGAKVDGHDYIAEAKSRGAIGVMVSRSIETDLPTLLVSNTVIALGEVAKAYRAQFSLPIMALTGSCGKTTVKEMTALILEEADKTLATQGNYNTEIGVPLTLLQLNNQHQRAVIELGARKKGDIHYLMDMVKPNIALITNAGAAHLEMFGSNQGIAEAKGEIFSDLPPNGTAIMNADDEALEYWQGLLKPTQTLITFGLDNKADVNVKKIQLEADFSEFICETTLGIVSVRLPVPGLHNVKNAAAAIAASIAFGVSLNVMKTGLERFVPVAGRLQYKVGVKGAMIIDDTYNANPVSMKAAIAVLSKYSGKKILIIGDMLEIGLETKALHGKMGEEAKLQGVQQLFGFGAMSENAINSFGEGARHFTDKSRLVTSVLEILTNDTIVLVKGSRGMRMEEVVQGLIQTD
jgi:UDP-N-acetylmuramoyl-tripeptide--D-alanyl-D-alanine ligase